MGYSLAWLAIKGRTPESVREALGFRGTGKFESIPESDVTAALLPGGWYLIIADDAQVASDTALCDLTRGCEAVTCFVEEHVMVSTAAGWHNGNRTWTVSHESERGIKHLEAQGDLPAAFAPIRDRLFAQQLAEDEEDPEVDFIFDIPVALAESLTGYRHDGEIPDVGDRGFEVLQSKDAATKKSWLARLFGKGRNG